MKPFLNMILVLGFALFCSVQVIESSELNFLQRMKITDDAIRTKCSKDVKSDDKFSTCCNAKLPNTCQNMLQEVDGLNCTDVVGSAICTDCCTDLFEAGLAASKEACCPAGLCGDTIGCQPITGDCSCRSLDYFSGTVESCPGLGQPCNVYGECCAPYGCFEHVCSTCAGRNSICTQSMECCGTDACVNNKCVSCGIDGMSCNDNDGCCIDYTCVGGTCNKCVANGDPCTSSSQCCYDPKFDLQIWNYCDKRGSTDNSVVGVCQHCMTMEDTSPNGGPSRCTDSEQCCGELRCYEGSCLSCAIPGGACNVDSDCCNDGCPDTVSCDDGVCVPVSPTPPGPSPCIPPHSLCVEGVPCCNLTNSDLMGDCQEMSDGNYCEMCVIDGGICEFYYDCCSFYCADGLCIPSDGTKRKSNRPRNKNRKP